MTLKDSDIETLTRDSGIETFTAESKEEVEERLTTFHTKHPHIKVQSTIHRVYYHEQGGENHDYAIFYLK